MRVELNERQYVWENTQYEIKRRIIQFKDSDNVGMQYCR